MVTVGSARIDERGKATGGTGGDQTGKEVSTQAWYKHSKGWRVLRAKDAQVAEKIALCMENACANSNIGYDQNQRLTLYNAAQKVGFDCGKVQEKVETDCSALVRVCIAYAGINVENFRTTNQAKIMLASGAFTELTGADYTESENLLCRGDVLVTRTQGHTVVVLQNGSQAAKVYTLGSRILRSGSSGQDVEHLQNRLNTLGYNCGTPNGLYNIETYNAVKAFQQEEGLETDGEFGPLSMAALEKREQSLQNEAVTVPAPAQPVAGKRYAVTGNTVWLWDGHPDMSGKHCGIAKKDDILIALNTRGYVPVVKNQTICWISEKYLKEI